MNRMIEQRNGTTKDGEPTETRRDEQEQSKTPKTSYIYIYIHTF